MSKTKKAILAAVLAAFMAANATMTVILSVKVFQSESTYKDTKYSMFVGLNDKDTYAQIIPTDEAKGAIEEIAAKYVSGYTVQDAVGMWVDDSGAMTHENTVVCYFYDTTDETVYKIADEVIVRLNQNCVLIEKDLVSTQYYYGKD